MQEDLLEISHKKLREAIRQGRSETVGRILQNTPGVTTQQLLEKRYETAAVIKRPSSTRELRILHPNAVMVAAADWYPDVLDIVCAFKIAVEQSCAFEESGNNCSSSQESGITPLMVAAITGRAQFVRLLLKYGALPNASTSQGDTALIEACFEGHFTVVQTLIQANASIEQANVKGITPLMMALFANHAPIYKYLVALSANLSKTDRQGRNALFYCIPGGHLDSLIYLLENGAVIKTDETANMTLLMESAYHGHRHIVAYLVERLPNRQQLDVLSQDTHDKNALFYACEGGQVEIMRYFIDHGLKACRATDDSTLLMVAALKGHLDIVQHLVENKEIYNIDPITDVDLKGRSVLFYCTTGANIRCFEYLHNTVGVPLKQSSEGISLLMQAIGRLELPFVSYLLDNRQRYRLDLAQRDDEGWDAMFYAVATGELELVKRLLQLGIRASQANDGRNLLMQACIKGHVLMATFINQNAASFGIELNQRDAEGWNLLYYCLRGGSQDLFDFFLHSIEPGENSSGVTLLMKAAELGRETMLLKLLEKLPDNHIHSITNDGRNALFYACQAASGTASTQILEKLLRKGVQPRVDHNGVSLLMHAAAQPRGEPALRYLLQRAGHYSDSLLSITQVDQEGRNALFYALRPRSLESLKRLLAAGLTPQRDHQLATPLMLAAKFGSQNALKFLIDQQNTLQLCELQLIDQTGKNVLFYAAEENQIASFRQLLHRGAVPVNDYANRSLLSLCYASGQEDICIIMMDYHVNETPLSAAIFNGKDNDGRTVFHHLAFRGDLASLKLIAQFYDPQFDQDKDGETVFMKAAHWKSSEMLQFLLDNLLLAEERLFVTDKDGLDALGHSCLAGHLNNARLLLSYGLKPRSSIFGENLLHLAAQSDSLELFQHILRFILRDKDELNAILSPPEADKSEPLFSSRVRGQEGKGEYLKYVSGRSTAHLLAAKGHVAQMQLFIKAGGSCATQDIQGATPLMLACSCQEKQLALLVLRAAPDQVHLVDKKGSNALHYCCQSSNINLVVLNMLVDAGLDVNAQDDKGNSPLHYAVLHPTEKAVRLLLDCGANAFQQNLDGINVFKACPQDNRSVRVQLDQRFGLDPRQRAIVESLMRNFTDAGENFDFAQLAENLAAEDTLLCRQEVAEMRLLCKAGSEECVTAMFLELLCKRAGTTFLSEAGSIVTENEEYKHQLRRFCVQLQALVPALAFEWKAQLYGKEPEFMV